MGKKILQSKSIAEITNVNDLSKIIPRMSKSDLDNVSDSQMIQTLVRLVSASSQSQINLYSSQVVFKI